MISFLSVVSLIEFLLSGGINSKHLHALWPCEKKDLGGELDLVFHTFLAEVFNWRGVVIMP